MLEKMKEFLLTEGLILAMFATPVVFGTMNDKQKKEKLEERVVSISGKPLSVSHSQSYLQSSFSTVLEVDGKRILAYANSGSSEENSHATSLIQSEIDDNDNEHILLKGVYDKENRFKIKSVNASRYSVRFNDFYKD